MTSRIGPRATATGPLQSTAEDRAKTLYEKVHVRPIVGAAFDVLRDKDASDADKLRAKSVLHRLYGRPQLSQHGSRQGDTDSL